MCDKLTIGNVGKSWFASYCAVKHDAFVVGNGKSADIKYAYAGQRVVIFDSHVLNAIR